MLDASRDSLLCTEESRAGSPYTHQPNKYLGRSMHNCTRMCCMGDIFIWGMILDLSNGPISSLSPPNKVCVFEVQNAGIFCKDEVCMHAVYVVGQERCEEEVESSTKKFV